MSKDKNILNHWSWIFIYFQVYYLFPPWQRSQRLHARVVLGRGRRSPPPAPPPPPPPLLLAGRGLNQVLILPQHLRTILYTGPGRGLCINLPQIWHRYWWILLNAFTDGTLVCKACWKPKVKSIDGKIEELYSTADTATAIFYIYC